MTRRAAAIVIGLALTGCSTGDGTDLDAREPAKTTAPVTASAATAVQGATSQRPPVGIAPSTPATVATGSTLPAEPVATTAAPEPAATESVAPAPETGVPGLDAADAFCSAWSRFGGSFQVIAVHAAFGPGTAESTARYELLAAPTVGEAYDALAANWPEAIAAELEAAHVERFGPLAARLAAGRAALADAGLDAAGADALRAAWLDALATRDQLAAEIEVDLSAELAAVVDAAIPLHLDAVGPWADDTSLVTDVPTPLTDAYLSTECPDQGTLAGQEVD